MTLARDVAAILCAYLLGSMPFGVWMGHLHRGVDIREHGSGGSGATNVLRTAGPGAAAATFILDIAKGAVAVVVAHLLGADQAFQLLAGLAAMVGHCWPVWARFRGGKAVATGLGALIVIAPGLVLWAVAGGVVALAITRIVSVASLCATAAAALAAIVTAVLAGSAQNSWIFVVPAALLVAYRHRANLGRLLRGAEPKLSLSAASIKR